MRDPDLSEAEIDLREWILFFRRALLILVRCGLCFGVIWVLFVLVLPWTMNRAGCC